MTGVETLVRYLLDHLSLTTVVWAVIAAGGAVILWIGINAIPRVSLSEEARRVSGVRELTPLDRLQVRLDQSGLQLRVVDLVRVGLLIGACAALVFAILGFVTVAIVAFACGPVVYYLYTMGRRDRVLHAFRQALPDAIDDCADYISSGMALPQVIDKLGNVGPEPIRPMFRRVQELAQPGTSLMHALRRAADERSEVFFRQFMLVLATYVEKGNEAIVQSLARISHAQRVQLTLQERINASQAGARIVAYVYAVAPVAFLVFMRFFGGEAYPRYYQSPVGQLTQAFVVLSGVVTYWLAQRVANRGIYFDEIERYRTAPERARATEKPRIGFDYGASDQ